MPAAIPPHLRAARRAGPPAGLARHGGDRPRGRAVRLLARHRAAACLIILSHEPDVDVPVLAAALTTGVPYVGALGSGHTRARRAADLTEAGLDEELLGRIHGPVGLDLGARTPAETALAICAEVLGALDGGEVRVLREGRSR
ncbi:XdhC family protein [Streptomyces puniciscabiei]|nr:XdhC family protein [Streptomyces puniciscabiei]